MPRPARPRIATLGLCSALAMGASSCPQPGIVGDANGDGVFSAADVTYLAAWLERPRVAEGVAAASDVAAPCAGYADAADTARLEAALHAPVPSDCHGERTVGQRAALPAKRPPQWVPPRPATLDQQFAAVGALVAEFGGIHVAPSGAVQVVLTHPDRLQAAVDALEEVFGWEALPGDVFEAVRGDFRFLELDAIRREARELFALEGVVLVDVDEVRNRVVVGVEHDWAASQVAAELASRGIRLDRVLIELRALPEPHAALGGGEVFSAKGGCTLGLVAKRTTHLGLLTSMHCALTPGVPTTTFVDAQANPLASELVTANWILSGDPACPQGEVCAYADVTFAALEPGVTGQRGAIHRAASPAFPYQIVSESLYSFAGQAVRKVGAATGETQGVVQETCADVYGDWANPPQNAITDDPLYLCQTRADYASGPGDSGSPVFRVTGHPYEVSLHGLHWGGNGWLSPMSMIHYELAPLWTLESSAGNEPPNVEIVAPDPAAATPAGWATLEAFVWDFETGLACPGCSVKWFVDGQYLGQSSVSNGVAVFQAWLGPDALHPVSAVAVDGAGDSSTHTLWVGVGGETAAVSIVQPGDGASLYRNVYFVLEGTSWIPEGFGALPCDHLEWTPPPQVSVPVPSGCAVIALAQSTGPKTLTLTGKDANGTPIASDAVTVQVLEPPTNAPPYVKILAPIGALLDPNEAKDVRGMVYDFDQAGPTTFEWILDGPGVVGGPLVLRSGSVPPGLGGLDWFSWTPEQVTPGCGGSTLTLELRATDTNGTASDQVPVVVAAPPC